MPPLPPPNLFPAKEVPFQHISLKKGLCPSQHVVPKKRGSASYAPSSEKGQEQTARNDYKNPPIATLLHCRRGMKVKRRKDRSPSFRPEPLLGQSAEEAKGEGTLYVRAFSSLSSM